VSAFLSRHFSRPAREGRCVHGELRDGERVIDDPVVVASAGGRVADVNLHGGPWVVRAALDLARRAGFEAAESPGVPVPAEGVDGETELEREVLSHLPLARTELAVRVLLAQRQQWVALGDEFTPSPGTPGEGGGEGSREDVVLGMPPPSAGSPHPLPAYRERGQERLRRIRSILADHSLWWLLHPPRVAIIGAANVGKSTLANQLFAQERSITADLPGTTRDWVGEMADVNGLAVMLVDTPGLRATADPVERAAIERGREQIAGADLVVLVLDPTRPPGPEQAALIDAYPEALRVVNKADRAREWSLPDAGVIHTVATTGRGVDELRWAIAGRFGCDVMDVDRPRWWTMRQRKDLERLASIA
jgi:tRNA modification GTPase